MSSSSKKRSIKGESTTVVKKAKLESEDDHDITTVKEEHIDVKQKPIAKSSISDVSWRIPDVISAQIGIPAWASENVVKLLDEGCTIPFIARYRKEKTGDMDVQKIRDTCSMLEELRTVENKVMSAKTKIQQLGKMTRELNQALSNAQTLTEVECLYAPYKPGVKGSLAERARNLGLEPLAIKVMTGVFDTFQADQYINTDEKALQNRNKVLEGVKHIVADIIHKNTAVMETVREMSNHRAINLVSTKAKAKKTKPKPGIKVEPDHKYENYFDFRMSVSRIYPHQVMAINRGENHSILSVKIDVPNFVKEQVQRVCFRDFPKALSSPSARKVFIESFEDCYSRLIQPQICRLVRSHLTKIAEKASIEVFASNLKNLLLSAPLKGNTILAIDPGFKNGCKSAVISQTGQVLDTTVLYIHSHGGGGDRSKLENLIRGHSPDVIGIGNGQACRETEEFVSRVIQQSFPKLKYCIVSESGASIYSVSDIAQKELPDLDQTLRGAVSIGRRLLDPLAEYVKVDPKHLSVGQYQHDLPKNQLHASLDSTIEECVSFVGVDINTCSDCLLQHVSGLSANVAKKVIEHRNTNGPFVCRNSLRSVKGVGEKTFEQAAGFIRVHHLKSTMESDFNLAEKEAKNTANVKKKKKVASKKEALNMDPNPLDQTCIHPESYSVTEQLLSKMGVHAVDLGTQSFIEKVTSFVAKHSTSELNEELQCGEPTVRLIMDALSRPLSYDLRDDFEKPLFRNTVKSMTDLQKGHKVTGKVMNVTNFGAFVDIGVGTNALIHEKQMYLPETRQKYPLKLGDKVEAEIVNIEHNRKRIGMSLLKVF